MRNRLVAVLAVVVACFVALPSPARAEVTTKDVVTTFSREWYPHVIWSEDYSVEGNIDDYRHALIMADNRQDAALLLIGKGPNGVSNDVRKYLSDSTYSPHFAKLVDALDLMGELGSYPSWVPSTVRKLWTDPQYTYYGTLDTYDIKQAYKEWLAAEKYAEDGTYPELSGPAPSNYEGDYFNFCGNPVNGKQGYGYIYYTSGGVRYSTAGTSGTVPFPSPVRFRIPVSLANLINSQYSLESGNTWFVKISLYNGSLDYPTIFAGKISTIMGGDAVRGLRFNSAGKQFNLVPGSISFDASTSTFTYRNTSFNNIYNVNSGKVLDDSSNDGVFYIPVASEYPNPVAPAPSGTWSEPEPEPKWGVDIDWYDDEGDTSDGDTNVSLSGTTVYNSENNTYITNNNIDVSSIVQRLDALNRMVSQIGIDLRTIDADLTDGFLSMRNYLEQVVQWMRLQTSLMSDAVEKLDELDKSTNDLPDLSTIESSLRDILSKLDSSVSNVGDTDLSSVTTLVDDVEGQLDTIANRIGNLVNGVPSVPRIEPTNTVVTDDEQTIGKQVGQKAEELSRRFPFSLPWDVQFILSLLVRAPAAPVFDLPVIGSDDAVVHVDLSAWEPVAVVCRQATKILFALGLALRTRQLVSSWGSSGD